MYGRESWTVKKAQHWRIDAFELWCWRRLLRVPWTARRSNQEISPECSLKGLMLKLKLQYSGHVMWRGDSFEKTLMLGKVEGRRRRGRQRMRWLDGITDSGHGFGWTPAVGDGQGGLTRCGSWGCKESDTTERLNYTELTCWNWAVNFATLTSFSCSSCYHQLNWQPQKQSSWTVSSEGRLQASLSSSHGTKTLPQMLCTGTWAVRSDSPAVSPHFLRGQPWVTGRYGPANHASRPSKSSRKATHGHWVLITDGEWMPTATATSCRAKWLTGGAEYLGPLGSQNCAIHWKVKRGFPHSNWLNENSVPLVCLPCLVGGGWNVNPQGGSSPPLLG